jgi:hypothetical protein
MKNRIYETTKERYERPLNLQMFAEDGDGGSTGDGNDSGAGEGDDSNNEDDKGGDQKPTFDDFLKDADNQSEFDRRVNKAIDKAVSNAQRKWQTLTDDKVSEAEKLAKMTKEEKAEYRASKLEKELESMKRQNALTEMSKTARKMLSEEEINIPDELLTHLVTADASGTKTAVDSFVKLFKSSVQAAVKDALRGNAPKGGTGSNRAVTKDQILAIKDRAERQHMIAEHMDLFQ